MKNKLKKSALAVGSVIFWIAVWHIGASVANSRLLIKIPLPADTLALFLQNCGKEEFRFAVFVTVARIITGFLCAVIFGILGGLLAGHSTLFKGFSSPVLHLVRTVPVAAFIIVAWLWIPSRALPPFISFLMVMPIIWSHTQAGLSSIDKKTVEAARVFGLKKSDIIFKVKLPMISPQLRAGCITGLGIAWKAGVAAEVISTPSGSVGSMLRTAKTAINYEQVFAVTLAVILISLILENLLKLIWREQKR